MPNIISFILNFFPLIISLLSDSLINKSLQLYVRLSSFFETYCFYWFNNINNISKRHFSVNSTAYRLEEWNRIQCNFISLIVYASSCYHSKFGHTNLIFKTLVILVFIFINLNDKHFLKKNIFDCISMK